MIQTYLAYVVAILLAITNSQANSQDKTSRDAETIELRVTHGTDNEDLDHLMRFEKIYMEKVELRGGDLAGAQYQLLVKEFKEGKLVGSEMLFDGTEAAIFQVDNNKLSFRMLCKTQDERLQLQISTSKFASRKLSFDLLPNKNDYALMDFVGAEPSKTVTTSEAFYLFAIIPPTLHADGSGSYCEVAQSEIDPEEFGSKFDLQHYFLVEMKLVKSDD